tara:strand:- start:23821 stop:25662 length:1842 start_codon:yes stop_codon:yes gene_type:complete
MEDVRLKINDKEVGLRKVAEGLYEPKNINVLKNVVNGGLGYEHIEHHFSSLKKPFLKNCSNPKQIESFCFVATKEVMEEADVLIFSLRLFHAQPIYVLCDAATRAHLSSKGYKDLFFYKQADKEKLDEIKNKYFQTLYSNINNFHRPEVIMRKMDIMKKAMRNHKNTFFLDADMIVLDSLQENFSSELAFSPHHYSPKGLHKAFDFGFFNAGYVFCSSRSFPDYWEHMYLTDSIFFEQECMDRIPLKYKTQTFDESHNVGFWREGRLNQELKHKSLHNHLFLTDYIESTNLRHENEVHRADCLEYVKKTNLEIYNYINKTWTIKNNKVAFVHYGKAAGVFTQNYIKTNVLSEKCKMYNSWWAEGKRSLTRDWTKPELIEIAGYKDGSAFVHNHHISWDSESLQAFLDEGWFTFSFLRNPKDLICSLYFWAIDRSKKGNENPIISNPLKRHIVDMSGQEDINQVSLDDFFKFFITDTEGKAKKLWVLPDYIDRLDYVAEFSDENFRHFLKTYFNHEYIKEGYYKNFSKRYFNGSGNKGYDFYHKNGDISEETHQMISDSEEYNEYLQFMKERQNPQLVIVDMLQHLDKHSMSHRRALGKKVGIDFFKDNPHLKC